MTLSPASSWLLLVLMASFVAWIALELWMNPEDDDDD